MIIRKRILGLVLAAASIVGATSAMAADYEPPVFEAPVVEDEYVPVEIGSGWYLRGDIGYAANHPYDIFELPGYTEKQQPTSGWIGMGYHFNDFIRAEFDAGILPTSKFANTYASTCEGTTIVTVTNPDGTTSVFSGRTTRGCEGSDNGNNKAYAAMAKGFVDLGTFSGVTPYLGAGLGMVYSKRRFAVGDRNCVNQTTTSGATTTDFICDAAENYEGLVDAESQYQWAYTLGAGLAYQVTKNVALDVGYEYFAAPSSTYVHNTASGPAISKGFDYHTVKVGLRYDLW